MERLTAFTHWLATPFRAIGRALHVVVNLSGEQMRSLFSFAMMSGMFSLSMQNIWFTFIAKSAVDKGELFRPFFALIQEQMRFNSALIAWFAVIMGLIVFGAGIAIGSFGGGH